MKRSTEKAEKLMDKYLGGQCTPEEAALVETWFNKQSKQLTEQRAMQRRTRYWLGIAASIMVIGALALYVMDHRVGRERQGSVAITDIAPGTHRATLTLANGQAIKLDSTQGGIVMGDGGIRYTDGNTIGEDMRPGTEGLADKTRLLELTTPRGGEYYVVLPDGTKVWLNAASSLRYPAEFTGDTRLVELEGEAYFSVNRQPSSIRTANGGAGSKPFIVRSKNQETRVLGTEFNIAAYAADAEMKTTLAKGAIRVSWIGTTPAHAPFSVHLVPGEQAVVQKDGELTKQTVNLTTAIAWKNGRFSFDGKSFSQIMDEMARWYDLEVVYEGPIPTERFIGGAFRNSNLSIILSLLESAHIQYRLEGERKLIIQNKK